MTHLPLSHSIVLAALRHAGGAVYERDLRGCLPGSTRKYHFAASAASLTRGGHQEHWTAFWGKRLPPIDPQKIVAVLAKAGKPMDRHQIASRLKVRYQRLIRLMDSLVAKGLVKFAGENRYTVTR